MIRSYFATYTMVFFCLFSLPGCGAFDTSSSTVTTRSNVAKDDNVSFGPVHVTGTVWLFDADGRYVDYGGPVGTIHNSELFMSVAIADADITLETASHVRMQSTESIQRLTKRAQHFCDIEGYQRDARPGVVIFTRKGTAHLIGFCGPHIEFVQ